MSAQAVFDCEDIRREIFSYCLPQYPVVTLDMIYKRHTRAHLALLTHINGMRHHKKYNQRFTKTYFYRPNAWYTIPRGAIKYLF